MLRAIISVLTNLCHIPIKENTEDKSINKHQEEKYIEGYNWVRVDVMFTRESSPDISLVFL